MLRNIYRRARRTLLPRTLGSWKIEGLDRSADKHTRLLFIGNEKNKNYIKHLAFSGGCIESEGDRIPISNLRREIDFLQCSSDLLVAQIDDAEQLPISRDDSFLLPAWFDAIIDFDLARTQVAKSKNVKEDLRKIKKYSLRYRIVRSESDFDMFYHEMYLPLVRTSHKDRALPISFEKLKANMHRSEILQILLEDEPVSASMILYGENEVHGWKHGLKNGNKDYAKKGCIAALFYFEIEYLRNKGYESINHGGTRPFFLDGVFQNKKKWGMRAGKPWGRWFYLKANRRSEMSLWFLRNNPFLHIYGNKYYGALFVNEENLDKKKLDRLIGKCYIDGVDKMNIYCPQEFSDNVASTRYLKKKISFQQL